MEADSTIDNTTKHTDIINYLQSLSDPKIAEQSARYFKTSEGEYGHGDVFIGIRMPVLRNAVKIYRPVNVVEAEKLLKSSLHEVRLFALLLLVDQFSRGSDSEKEKIFNLYLANTEYVNNWDLVDSSAHLIVGEWLLGRDRSQLYHLALSDSLWKRRIAIMATFNFIKKNSFDDTLALAEILLNDSEDLIHKAVGWMLREVGKRDVLQEEVFLLKHYKTMPRTMLRYAIEKFDAEKRQQYLKGRL
jgi:3-methyladenine DNA glycosylase AlkD